MLDFRPHLKEMSEIHAADLSLTAIPPSDNHFQ